MMRDASTLLLAAALLAAGGCSRTYDGTVVPTYQMTVAHYVGVPVVTMQRTPLEQPSAALEAQAAAAVFPPPPPAPAQATVASEVNVPPRRRTIARRAASSVVAAKPDTPLVCQKRESEDRPVSVVCE